MSASEQQARTRPRSLAIDLALAAALLLAFFAATLPLLRVVAPGPWVSGALGMTAIVLAVGAVARWLRLTGLLVSILELAVWIVVVTAAFGRGTGVLAVVPTLDTFSLMRIHLLAAVEEVELGVAPVPAGAALTFLIVAAVGLLAIMLDHVVITARMPLLGAVGLAAVFLIPSIAVSSEVDIVAFVVLAAAILLLLGIDTAARRRERTPGERAPRMRLAGASSAPAVGIGAIAIVVAMVASPLLPEPGVRSPTAGGATVGNTINSSLELGNDLRQPGSIDVLRVRSDSPPPYLRVATLSRFDGSTWKPDEGELVPFAGDRLVLDRVPVDEGIAFEEFRASVEILDLRSPQAPVPYPATEVIGLDGEWAVAPDNRTIDARRGSSQSQSYEVVTAIPAPSLGQIRARPAAGPVDPEVYKLPSSMPPVIAATAAEVTAEARTDFDQVIALQSWFRGSQFTYSLDAPVSEGFDGSGVEAIAEFLEVREGYCVHFAAAFAVMARSLEMPARVVVGYLPGLTASTTPEGESIYVVESSQLHAWPEVHFEGIGWVPFEPTNSLGSPTRFQQERGTTPGAAPSPDSTPGAVEPEPAPTSSAGGPVAEEPESGPAAPSDARPTPSAWPFALALAALLLIASPALLRGVRRRRLSAAAASGDATAAWLSVQETAVDLGIPVPAAESPRAFGARLREHHGAEATAMTDLVRAIERASYAKGAISDAGSEWADAAATVSANLIAAATPARRFLARVAPRSLLVRPGAARPRPPVPEPRPAGP